MSLGKILRAVVEEAPFRFRFGTNLAAGAVGMSYKRGCQVKNTSPYRNARDIFRHPAPLAMAPTLLL
jgi:hypothetical protein